MNFKKSFIIMIMMFIVLCLSVGSAFAADLDQSDFNGVIVDNQNVNIDSSNNDAVLSGSEDNGDISYLKSTITPTGNTFADIQNAINSASAGDTIELSGEYIGNQRITINKQINLIGNNASLNGQTYGITITSSASNVIFKNINFINSNVESYFIAWSGNNGNISDCTFNNCTSGNYHCAGPFYCQGANCSMSNCSFSNCRGTQEGGAVSWTGNDGFMSDCSFVNCYDVWGGAVHWRGYNGVIDNCSFNNCAAENFGGAVDWFYSVNGSMSNCIFTNCTAKGYESAGGGAVRWYDSFDGNMSNCIFINCSSVFGGVAYWNNANGSINNCSFVNNFADIGSAIYSNRVINISNSEFRDNQAKSFELVVTNNSNSVSLALITGDNIMNAIYGEDTVYVDEATINASSHATDAIKRDAAPYQNIITKLYDSEGNLLGILNGTSDSEGILNYSFADLLYAHKIIFEHPENTYCTEIDNTFSISKPANNIINSSDVAGKINTTVNVPINVYINGSDSKVPVKNVTVKFNGETKTVNVTDGYINLTLPENKGVYELFIQFNGYDNYNTCNTTVNITALPINTNISVNNISGKPGSSKKVIIDVIDENGNPVVDGNIYLTLNGKTYTSTVKEGKAIFDIVLPNKAGNYTFTVKYNGTNYYGSSFATGLIEVIGNNETNTTNNTGNESSGVSILPKTGNPLLVLVVALLVLPILRRKQ